MRENSSDPSSWYASGSRAQTNMVPRGGGTSQPMRLNPSMRASRRDW